MALDFPSSPSVGQLYPTSPPAGVPQYRWDGTVWNALVSGASFVTTFNGRVGAVVPVQGDYPTSLIPGTTTNDNAVAGNIGQIISSTIPESSGIAIGSGGQANITSISLTAGDWDVTGIAIILAPNTATVLPWYGVAISTTSNSVPALTTGTPSSIQVMLNVAGNLMPRISTPVGPLRISLAATTTVYLVGELATWSGGNVTFYGTIMARRIR